MRYEKIIYTILFIVSITGCNSTRGFNTSGASNEYSYISGQLEILGNNIADGVEQSAIRITDGIRTVETIADEIEQLERYIKLYDREVEYLRDSLNSAENQIRQLQKDIDRNQSSVSNSDSTQNTFDSIEN